MEVVRSNDSKQSSTSVRVSAAPILSSVRGCDIKPRLLSAMEEEEKKEANRKMEIPSRSRFCLKKPHKPRILSAATDRAQQGRFRSNGSVINTPLPPRPLSSSSHKLPPNQIPHEMTSDVSNFQVHRQKHHLPHHQNQSPVTTTSLIALCTNFSRLIAQAPPRVPDGFLRPTNTLGKIKVVLRITPLDSGRHQSCLNVDPFRRYVTVVDLLSGSGGVSALYRAGHAPKMFLYDKIVTEAEPQSSVCHAALPDAIHAVVGGLDGCVMSYGHTGLGKTFSLIGSDDSTRSIGLIPTAISWLYQLIADRNKQTGVKFSVGVSATEVVGKHEEMRDLLATDVGPTNGAHLENLRELKAGTVEQAGYYLDLALAGRSAAESIGNQRNSHFMFTLHVYQHTIPLATEQSAPGNPIHSRLHLIDFGSCSKTREGSALSLSALGMLILALLNGQRHLPYRESRLAQIVKSTIGSNGCHSTVLVHVTGNPHVYNETLQILQLTSRMNRLKMRKKSKTVSSSVDSFSQREFKLRKGVRMGTQFYSSGCEGGFYSSGSSFDCSSAACSGPPSTSGSFVALDPVFESRYESLTHRQRIGGSTSGISKLQRYDRHHHQRNYALNNRSAPSSTVSAPAYSQRRILSERTNADDFKLHCHSRRDCRKFSRANELWIDGPKAEYSERPEVDESLSYKQSKASGDLAGSRKFGAAKERYEQWVDGPPEFQTGTLTRANVSIQKISYSKIVKVASLRYSADVLEANDDDDPSVRKVFIGDDSKYFGTIPPSQSNPNCTLKKSAPSDINIPESLQRVDCGPTSFKCLPGRIDAVAEFGKDKIRRKPTVLQRGGRGTSHQQQSRDFLKITMSAREQGDGKEGRMAVEEFSGDIGKNRVNDLTRGEILLKNEYVISRCTDGKLGSSLASDTGLVNESKMFGVPLVSSRESVYEMQMDKDLEFASGSESLKKLACCSDDEGSTLWSVCLQTIPRGMVMRSGRTIEDDSSLDSLMKKYHEKKEEVVDGRNEEWMERDFDVETFYVPVELKPTKCTVTSSSLMHCSAQGTNAIQTTNSCKQTNSLLIISSGNNEVATNNYPGPDNNVKRKTTEACLMKLSGDEIIEHTLDSIIADRTSRSHLQSSLQTSSLSDISHFNQNSVFASENASKVLSDISKQAKISKVPKLRSSKIIETNLKSVSNPPKTLSSSEAVTLSSSYSFSGLPIPAASQSNFQEPASRHSGKSFLQKLRTPLFFRCKNQANSSSQHDKLTATQEKAGKLISKVKLFSKNVNSSPALRQKSDREVGSKLTPQLSDCNAKQLQIKLSHVTNKKFTLDLETNRIKQHIPASASSPVIDHTYHHSVMQLMSSKLSHRPVQTTDVNSGKTNGGSDSMETSNNFASGSILWEAFQSPDGRANKSFKKERSRSEPFCSIESVNYFVQRDSRSTDILSDIVSRKIKIGKCKTSHAGGSKSHQNDSKINLKNSQNTFLAKSSLRLLVGEATNVHL